MHENKISITTDRFKLRELNVDDISLRYLSWLKDPLAEKWILAALETSTYEELKLYVASKSNSDDVAFFGIFCLDTGLHIGNVKYEPINSEEGYAILGILIGDQDYQGKKVAAEVIIASSRWLKLNRNVYMIILEVNPRNINAIKLYKQIGFVEELSPYTFKSIDDAITMVWNI
jgi:[ribosomal protein S5]-alanine N-acetyltransferase